MTPTNRIKNRIGFTIVELLMVIAIIAVMSSMALAVMAKSQQDAKEAATLSRIELIESIIAVQMEDYEVRRVPISNNELAAYVRANPNHIDGGGNPINVVTQVRQLRRQILMDIINSELPRPVFNTMTQMFELNPDLGVFPSDTAGIGTGSLGFREWLNQGGTDPNYPEPSSYRLSQRLGELTPSKVQSFHRFIDPQFNLPGEYLYAILAMLDVDGTPAIELLGNSAVGDSDLDGIKEVVDAWGDPMQLRLWQIDGMEVADKDGNPPPGTDVWTDVDPNFDFDIRDPTTGIPKGYRVLDPTQARDLSKIRAEVVSTRLVY